MGDVIFTEPIARALRSSYREVELVTEYSAIGTRLAAYDKIIDYDLWACGAVRWPADEIVLAYELFPSESYVKGYARCANLEIIDTRPRVRGGTRRRFEEPYVLLAPLTSSWWRTMRAWPRSRFDALEKIVPSLLGYRAVVLDESYSFDEMLSLIEHCFLFVGNDSGPAVLAQCFGCPSVIIFGCTSPKQVVFQPNAFAISAEVGCNGCRQYSRDAVVGCAAPLCLRHLSVEEVMTQMERAVCSEAVRSTST